jgi:hypothetical protein
VNELANAPDRYNALTHNCTTPMRGHIARGVADGGAGDWRILANGYLDCLAYERGTINTSLLFEELRRQSDVTEGACGRRQSGVFKADPRRPAKAARR